MLLSLLQQARGCVVAKVIAVCVAPYIWIGQFSAFLLPFKIEESEGTSATTAIRGRNHAWSLLVEVPSFMDRNSYNFVVVEDNDKNV